MKTDCISRFLLAGLAAVVLSGISANAQTWTFDNSNSVTFIPTGSFGYNPTVPNFRYNYGSAHSSAAFQWSSQDANGNPRSGSIGASLTLNENLDTNATKGAFVIDLAGGSGINASALSFDLMIAPGSATDQYGGYGDIGIATLTGGWGTFNAVWDGPSPETNYEFGTSSGVPYTAGTWYHFNIPLTGATGTGINAINIQDYDGGLKIINGTIHFFIDNLALATKTQTITLQPGAYTLVGCQVNGSGGNDINNASFLQVPSQLSFSVEMYVFQCGGGFNSDPYIWLDSADASPGPAGWYDEISFNYATNVVWNPGEGMVLVNDSGSPASLTLNGAAPIPVLPPRNYCGCGQWSFFSSQTTNATSTYQDITGYTPANGAQVSFSLAPTTNPNNPFVITNSDSFSNGTWTPSVPILTNGQAAFFFIPCQTSSPPQITIQPLSQTNYAGTNASFNVTASGTAPLSYQWELNGTNLSDNVRITGSRSNILTITSVLISDTGNYSVLVSNSAGSTNSAPARLAVLKATPLLTWPSPAAITYGTALGTSQLNATASVPGTNAYAPPTGTVLNAGTNALSDIFMPNDAIDYNTVTGSVSLVVLRAPLTVTASNVSRPYGQTNPPLPVAIVGMQNGDNITATGTCVAIASSPPGVYSILPVLSDSGNRLPNYSVTTNNGTLTVTCPVITLTPISLSNAIANTQYNQTLTASGSTGVYSFAISAGALPAGLSLSSGGMLSGTNVNAGTNTFTINATDQFGCVGSQTYTLITVAPPTISTPPQSQSVLAGSNAVFTVTATGTGPLNYQWFFNGTPLNSGGQFTGVNSNVLTIANAQPTNAGGYSIVITNFIGSVTSAVVTLGVILPPDLAPTMFTAASNSLVFYPTSPQSPTVQVSWAVTNLGPGAATGYWYDAVYVSTNITLAGEVGSSDYSAPSSLPVGGQYAETNTITLPQQSGTYILIFRANDGRNLQEANYSNNIATFPIFLTYQVHGPDLAPISVSAPTTVSSTRPNPSFPVTWAVTNLGTGLASGGWHDRVWFSTNGVLDANSTSLGDFAYSQTVPAGGGYSQTQTVTLPMGASGNYTLFVQVNAGDNLYESNYVNNISASLNGTFNLTPPDLRVLSVSIPQQAWTGRSFDTSWVLTNAGTGVATGPWDDRIYLSATNQLRINLDQVIGDFEFDGQLAPGQSVQLIQPVTINSAGVTNGLYYVSVFADVSNNVFEVIKTNNIGISSSNLSVQVTPLPELVLASVDAPTNGIGGQPVGVSWIVCNQGAADTDVPFWYDHLYLSTTTNLTGKIQDFGQYENPSYLLSGDCYEQDVTVTLPVGVSGPFYFIVSADSTGLVGEDNGTNVIGNTVQPINIQLVTPGFLHVASVQVAPAPPTVTWPSSQITCTYVVQNIGQTAITSSWDDRIALSQGSNYVNGVTTTGVLENDIGVNGPLAPGATYTNTGQFILPQTVNYLTVTGTWFVVPVVDIHFKAGGNGQGTSTIGRDELAAPLDVIVPPPSDLAVTNVSAPTTGYAGQSVNVSWVVNNEGLNGTTASSWYDGVYLSTNGVFDINQDLLLGYFANWGSLGIGASYTNHQSVTLPASLLPFGVSSVTNYLFVYADVLNTVSEITKTNNVLKAPSPLTVLPAPPPGPVDLAVASVSAPSTILAGGPASVFWTVTNEGAGVTGATNWVDSIYLSPDGTFNPLVDIWLADVGHNGALAPGHSYTVAQNLNTPYCTTGSYFVVVVTDSGYQVNTSGAVTNNVLASPNPMRILPNNAARLEVSSVSSVSSVSAGAPLTVSWTVANMGNSTAKATWVDGVFLSPSPVYVPGNGYLLARYTNQSNLASGGSYSHSGSYTVPPCFAGTYYVAVVTDLSNIVDSISCDTNNTKTASTSVQVLPSAFPSLQIAGLTLPTAATSGVPWMVQWSVTNAGPGAASGTWLDAVYASFSTTLDANTVLLGQFKHDGGLPAGGTYSQSQSVQIPACSTGQYYIFVATDITNAVDVPACQANNLVCSSNALPVNLALYPNLTVSSVSVPTTANSGQAMTISWIETNAGLAAANSPWADAAYLSADGTFNPARDPFLGYYTEATPLAPGASRTVSTSFNLPNIYGNFYVAVFADTNFSVFQCDGETNRVAVSATKVNVARTFYPHLQVTSVQVPANARAGQPITVTWVVTNDGTDTTGTTYWNDAVYLSPDEVLDPSDLRLGTFSRVRSLAVGQSYTNSDTIVIPPGYAGPFYILVLADSGGVLYEPLSYNDSLGWDPDAMLVTLPPPVDLAANNVTLSPASGVPGTPTTIGWTVSNVSTNDTVSTWSDAVYLSTKNFWDVTATLVTNINHTGLAALSHYNGSWTGPLPALTPGYYHAIVRADIRNTVPEANLSNNTAVSPSTISVDVPVIVLGQTVTNALTTGSAQFYKVNCPAGQTVSVTLTGASTNSFNELYVRFGGVPDLGNYDFIYNNPMAPNQQITIPTTQAGWYYIMVRGGNEPGGPLGYALSANIVPFAITSVTPTHIGDSGQVTITVNGSQFQPGASVQLVSGNNVYSAATNFFDNATSIRARFFFTNAVHGTYDVVLTTPGNHSTTTTQAITIETALPLTAQVIPGLVNSLPRQGTPFNWAGSVVNGGNVDIQYLTVVIISDDQYVTGFIPPSERVVLSATSPYGASFVARNIAPSAALNFSFNLSQGTAQQSANYYILPTVQSKQDVLNQVVDQAQSLRAFLMTNTTGNTITNIENTPPNLAAVLSDTNIWLQFFAHGLVMNGLIDQSDIVLLTNQINEQTPLTLREPSGMLFAAKPLDGIADCAKCGADYISCVKNAMVGLANCISENSKRTYDFCYGEYIQDLHECGTDPECAAGAQSRFESCLEDSEQSSYLNCLRDFLVDQSQCASDFAKCAAKDCKPPPPPPPSHPQCPPVPKGGEPSPWRPPGGGALPGGGRYGVLLIGEEILTGDASASSSDASGSGGGVSGGYAGGVCYPSSGDPNAKQGPAGYGASAFVGSQLPWLYTIYFENESNAPAFARQVSITDTLDPGLDIRTFRVGNIVVGNTTVTVPTNSTYYQTRISLPPPNPPNIVADITAGVDVQNHSLFWTMNAIDLNTGQLVTGTQEGVLPPDTTNNIGAGYVTFSIKPAAGVPTGTVVTNQASIVFDINDPIPTDTTTNTVNALPPTSFVVTLPPVINNNAFAVSWAGFDDPSGSGLASFNIYFSDNGGPYQVWLANTTSASAQFTGQFGHTYAFYSAAQDNSGNIEAAHATPDTTTLVSSPPVIAPVADQTINVGTAVIITNTVSEADQPAPALAYSLGPNAPAGASVNPTNGVFIWTPQCAQGSTTNLIEVMVTASDNPRVANSMLFNVVVGDCVQVGVGSTVVQTGHSATIPVNLFSTVALTNLTFTLVYPTNRFTNWTISATNPVGSAGTAQMLGPSNTFFGLTTMGGQVLQGPTVAGSITFSALPGSSAFIPLAVTAVAGTKADGSPAGNISGVPGRLVVIGLQSLLEARLSTNHQRMLTIYGNPGASYEVEYNTNLLGANWQYAWRVPMTNLAEAFAANGSLPQLFYRAFEFSANPPLLEMNSSAPSNLVLLLYGQNGTNYTLVSGTNLLSMSNWTSVAGFTLTNSFQFINVGGATNRIQFFRAKQPVNP